MNIVIITTLSRPELWYQTLNSLVGQASNWESHHLTIVIDGNPHHSVSVNVGAVGIPRLNAPQWLDYTAIVIASRVGASAARNIGAASIPKYRRQSHVLFLDDDVFTCPKWDEKLMELARLRNSAIMSGYAHPYNHGEVRYAHGFDFTEPLVISTVCMMMQWEIWDEVGPFDEPGGPGGSEDYALCMRAKMKGYGFAVTEPQCVIHTGLTSSSGKPIVGYDNLRKQNARLEKMYDVEGKVEYQ